jgi:quercetin dioxygenase-like cupin family protein
MAISNQNLSKEWETMRSPIVEMEMPHKDERGMILPLADEPMKSAVLISSKKGTVRANHYHHTDWHYCYVLKGAIDYYYRPAGSKEKPRLCKVASGQLFFTPPMLEHAMVFTEDTDFLCLGKNSREQEAYEADITRVQVYPFE